MYFQDITFGNVGSNGSYKNKNGWETLIGCDNSVFYNVKTVSYNKKAESKKTDKHGITSSIVIILYSRNYMGFT